jgi:hypothetical protein
MFVYKVQMEIDAGQVQKADVLLSVNGDAQCDHDNRGPVLEVRRSNGRAVHILFGNWDRCEIGPNVPIVVQRTVRLMEKPELITIIA